MLQVCRCALVQSTRLSPEDVSRLYTNVFHESCSVEEVHVALKKVREGDSQWSCVGEHVLDVITEMKTAKESEEKLYWEGQLLNAGQHVNSHATTCPHRSSKTSCWRHTSSTERKTRMEEEEQLCSVRSLHKAARHSWAKLVTEGVRGMLASPGQLRSTGVRGQAWGCMSASDVLLLMDVKYDVVTRLLYADMLQEHHNVDVWEALSPWQRHEEEVRLGDLAEEALEDDDMLRLAELPGAFRIYRTCPESSRECFTAVSLLYKFNTSRQQERASLRALAERLDKDSLSLMCWHIRLATLKAEREKTSNDAYLGAQQCWDMWPHVYSPCREEQAASLLHSGDVEEHLRDCQLSQQALLQLLVLSQEQERKQLVHLLHGVTLEDVQKPAPTKSPKADCVKRMKQIRHTWETSSEINKAQSDISRTPTEWSQDQLEQVSLRLLTHVMELQEKQASSLLQDLMNKGEQHLQGLQEEYESKLREDQHNNLLQLISPEASSTTSDTHWIQERVQGQMTCSGPAENQDLTAGPPQSLTTTSSEVNGGQTEGVPNKQAVCAGCGLTLGGLPYLEVSCVAAKMDEDAEEEEEEESQRKNQDEEEDAWSSQPEDHARREEDAVNVQTETLEGQSTAGKTEMEKLRSCLSPIPHAVLEPQDSSDVQRRHLAPAMSSHTVDVKDRPVVSPTQDRPVVSPTQDRPVVSPTQDRPVVSPAQDRPVVSPAQDRPVVSPTQDRPVVSPAQDRPVVSSLEREKTVRKLVDVHRRAERKQQRDRERQQLRVQERLSIIQSRKAEDEVFGRRHRDSMRHLTKELSQEDKSQQKTLVKEKLEQLRRERSFIMQSRRNKNAAGLKELLEPIQVHIRPEDTDSST
ncbi:uncharacterized protein LOC133659167 [Entelurus aequoreus]|uniref:uncharacterized protein LOC133659167 n=1 Tax=Entelurus aequoreus TaxID=161455 RepID=UPI002B1D9775|nr:uncharacterized protein LOC133659167 [Entelurus aequoreus]